MSKFSNSAYLLSEFDQSGHEARRLDAQAQAFLDLEFSSLAPFLQPDQKIIDFGCGTGVISRQMADLHPDCQVLGLDADAGSIEESQKALGQRKNLAYQQWRLEPGEVAPMAPVDLAFNRLLLMHLPDSQGALNSMSASVRPGGRVYSVECDDGLMQFAPSFEWQNFLIRTLESIQAGFGGTRRLGRQLPRMFEKAGLTDIKSEEIFYSKQMLGAKRFSEIFEPVMRHALAGRGPAEDQLLAEASEFIHNPDTELKVCFWHTTGVVS